MSRIKCINCHDFKGKTTRVTLEEASKQSLDNSLSDDMLHMLEWLIVNRKWIFPLLFLNTDIWFNTKLTSTNFCICLPNIAI